MTKYEFWRWWQSGDFERDMRAALIKARLDVSPMRLADASWKCGGWALARDTKPPHGFDLRKEDKESLLNAYVQSKLEPPPTVTPINPIKIGNFKGNFLTARGFFSPAMAAWDTQTRDDFLQWYVDHGWTHVVVNADQDNWGPRKGHPGWTQGGFNIYDTNDHTLRRFLECLQQVRSYNLTPIVGIVDQPRLRAWSIEKIIEETRWLIGHIDDLVGGYMLSWELNEVYTDSTERERNENKWIEAIADRSHGRPVGIHYSAARDYISRDPNDHDNNLGGGINRYQELERIYPQRVVRMLQYHNQAPIDVMVEQTHRTAGIVHADHGLGMFCAFEHSAGNNQPKIYTLAGQADRRQSILGEVKRVGLSDERSGYLN